MQNVSNTDLFSIKVNQLKQEQKYGIDQSISSVINDKSKVNKTETSFETIETIKKQSNRAILEYNLQVSVGAGNKPMALLFKTAIEGINEVLETNGLGENVIQKTYDSGIDMSPEATADRIISLSTGFFSQFQQQHTELSVEDAAKSFSEIIGNGIDKGFKEAREILDGLKVLQGDLASNIDSTYDLVKIGLQVFVDSYVKVENEAHNKN